MYQVINDNKRKLLKIKGVKRWDKQDDNNKKWKKRKKEVEQFVCRGEDTTTYGDATPWLQPGTPLGDLLIEIVTGRPPKKKDNDSGDKK